MTARRLQLMYDWLEFSVPCSQSGVASQRLQLHRAVTDLMRLDMKAKLIMTAEDYVAALKEIDMLRSAGSGTSEGERLHVLANQVQAYECEHFPMGIPIKLADR